MEPQQLTARIDAAEEALALLNLDCENNDRSIQSVRNDIAKLRADLAYVQTEMRAFFSAVSQDIAKLTGVPR